MALAFFSVLNLVLRPVVALSCVAVCLAMASCAGSQPLSTRQSGVTTVRVDAFDDSLRVVDSGMSDRRLSVVFPLIQGSLYGTPTMEAVFLASAQFGESFTLTESLVEAKVKPFADVASDQLSRSGLTVDPGSTRLLRLGTFLHDAKTGAYVSGAGFYDLESRDLLMLVYFDRPCRVSGTIRAPAGDRVHEIAVPASGIYWLRLKKTAPNAYRVQVEPQPATVVMATPVSSLRGK